MKKLRQSLVRNCLEDSTIRNPVHTRETRMCGGGIAPIPNFCLEGSTPPIRYSLPGWLVDGGSISEGILSFVEYAPRLRMVLPSRQLLITRLAKILKSILKILAENIGRHILPCFARASLRHLDKILFLNQDKNPLVVSPSYGLCLLQIPCWCEFSFSLVSLGGFPRKWASPSGSHYGKTKYGDKIAPYRS